MQSALDCLQLLVRLKECAEFVTAAKDTNAMHAASLVNNLLHNLPSLHALATAVAFLTEPLQKVKYAGE